MGTEPSMVLPFAFLLTFLFPHYLGQVMIYAAFIIFPCYLLLENFCLGVAVGVT